MNHSMTGSKILRRGFHGVLLILMAMLLSACEKPVQESVQSGYRGTGMVQIYSPSTLEANAEKNEPPFAIPAGDGSGPKAATVYKNVKLLGDLSVGQFTRLMVSMTSWVAPTEGCTYCHNPANFAEDTK